MKPVYTSLFSKKGNHVGGIVRMHVAPKEWLAADIVIDYATNKIIEAVSLIPGKDWISLGFTKPGFEYDDELKTNKSGDYYEVNCAGIMNNFNSALQQTIETIRYHQLLMIVTDRYKRQRFIGNLAKGMKITNRHAIKNNPGEESLAIKFFMESELSPPYVNTDDYITLPVDDDILLWGDEDYLLYD